jgi:hypothetical protein
MQTDAASLIAGFGGSAYEARTRMRQADEQTILDGNRPPRHWMFVKQHLAAETGHKDQSRYRAPLSDERHLSRACQTTGRYRPVLFPTFERIRSESMKGKEGDPPSNVLRLIKPTRPGPPSTASVLQGLQLITVFLKISSNQKRKDVLAFAKQTAADDANERTERL